ncbi:hypothetical protein [Streptomyces sp. NPDC005209]|uniref:hypothetical protein n=1 Tax=Streptomyces sp. NPDC005209 TaxID=3156715 RepID=UPI0033B9D03B
MRPSLIALAGAAAIALATGGYAVGAGQQDGTSERSAACEQTKHEFDLRADQIREQLRRGSQAEETDSHQITIDESRAKILGLIVQQNPTCFGVGARAAATLLHEHPSEGQADAALCDLTGTKPEDCSTTGD